MSPIRRRLLLALVVALAAGCTVGPRYEKPDVSALVPAEYPAAALGAEASGAAAPSQPWWKAYAEPELDRLVDAALGFSADLAAAEARVAQARELAVVAGAALYPQVNVDGRISRDQLSLNGENLALIPFKPATTAFTDYRLGFDASWEIDLFGRSRHQSQAAIARADSAAESRNDARLVLSAEVVRLYLDAAIAARRAAIATARSASYAETARLLGLARAAGVASGIDLDRAEVDAATSIAALAPLEADRQTAVYRLSSLTGLAPSALEPRLERDRIPAVGPQAVPAGLPADLLRRRPDVRRAERELAAATADAGTAVADQFPRLTLVGDLGLDSVRPGELVQAASRYWNAGPQLTVPLFAAGRLRAGAAAADAARTVAQANYRGAVLAALADAESALARYGADARQARGLHAARDRAAQALALTRLRHAAGEATLLDVADSERALDALEDQCAVADGSLARDYAALQKALGGDWQDAGAPGH